jgi:hypothetical protein
MTMNTAVEERETLQRVNLVLEDSAHCLTSQDVLKIAEIAEQARAVVHISYGSWQVLVGIPRGYHQLVQETLRAMGYESDIYSGDIDDLSTFVVKKGGR